MEDHVVNFIRDRFNSLEQNINAGFEDVKKDFGKHDKRIRSLEDDRLEKRTKLVAYGSIGGGVFTLLAWFVGKIF